MADGSHVTIPVEEYELLTELEAFVRKVASKNIQLDCTRVFDVLTMLAHVRLNRELADDAFEGCLDRLEVELLLAEPAA